MARRLILTICARIPSARDRFVYMASTFLPCWDLTEEFIACVTRCKEKGQSLPGEAAKNNMDCPPQFNGRDQTILDEEWGYKDDLIEDLRGYMTRTIQAVKESAGIPQGQSLKDHLMKHTSDKPVSTIH